MRDAMRAWVVGLRRWAFVGAVLAAGSVTACSSSGTALSADAEPPALSDSLPAAHVVAVPSADATLATVPDLKDAAIADLVPPGDPLGGTPFDAMSDAVVSAPQMPAAPLGYAIPTVISQEAATQDAVQVHDVTPPQVQETAVSYAKIVARAKRLAAKNDTSSTSSSTSALWLDDSMGMNASVETRAPKNERLLPRVPRSPSQVSGPRNKKPGLDLVAPPLPSLFAPQAQAPTRVAKPVAPLSPLFGDACADGKCLLPPPSFTGK